jgi:hypothetical protein
MGRVKIKLYGERNTGTRYLERLLGLNLDAELLRGSVPLRLQRLFGNNEAVRDLFFWLTYHRNLGWKHSMAPDPRTATRVWSRGEQALVFVTLTKNPYSWLLSLYRRPYHSRVKPGTFAEFLVSPWPTVRRERAAVEFRNPIDIWNRKNGSYLRLQNGRNTVNLRYEDLLADPRSVVSQLCSRFSIKSRSPEFRNVFESTKDRHSKDNDYYRAYYLGEKWRLELTQEHLRIVNEYLDRELMCAFGYGLLDAEVQHRVVREVT